MSRSFLFIAHQCSRTFWMWISLIRLLNSPAGWISANTVVLYTKSIRIVIDVQRPCSVSNDEWSWCAMESFRTKKERKIMIKTQRMPTDGVNVIAIKCVVTECIECIAMAMTLMPMWKMSRLFSVLSVSPITEMNTHRNDLL